MTLNLNQLRAFEAVTRAGSFAKAAERLGVTPPAVSLQISQLEQESGFRLFERHGRRIKLTPAGLILEEYVHRAFALVSDAERALEQMRSFERGHLRVIASPTAAAYYLPPLLESFKRRYPAIHVRIGIGNSERVRERLRALEDDVGVLGGQTDDAALVFERLVDDPLVAVLSPSHPWVHRRKVSLHDLAESPLILREPGSATRQLIEAQMTSLGITCRPVMEVESNEVIKRAVEIGSGVTILSRAVIDREVSAGLLNAVPIGGASLVRTIYLAYHRDRRNSPMTEALREAVGIASTDVRGTARKRRPPEAHQSRGHAT